MDIYIMSPFLVKWRFMTNVVDIVETLALVFGRSQVESLEIEVTFDGCFGNRWMSSKGGGIHAWEKK